MPGPLQVPILFANAVSPESTANLDIDFSYLAAYFLDDITELRETTPQTSGPPRVFVAGAGTLAGGGGNWYWYNPSDTTSVDNGYSIIVSDDGSRWYVIPPFGAIGNALLYGADPTGANDSTTALQNCINAAYLGGVQFYAPGGPYLISATLIPNLVDQVNYRGNAFRMYGDGAGPVFVPPGSVGIGRTIITCATDVPLLRYIQYLGSGTTSGNFYLDGIRFQQTNPAATSPVVQIDVCGEYSHIHHNEFYQAGTSDGIRCLEGTKGTIELNNILNGDWANSGVGSSRTGVGINVFSQYNAGLLTIRKNTCRGFLDGGVNGDGSHDLSCVAFYDNEFSNTYRGLTNSATNSKCLISHNYFEGIELTCIVDKGRYTTVTDNFLQPGTWTTGIDASNNGGGCVYKNNYIGLSPALSGVTGMVVAGSISDPTTVTDNIFVWGSSGTGLSNVRGLILTGSDAMISHHGNMFAPNAGWAGASNVAAFQNNTTSSTGSSGDGWLGLGIGMDQTASFASARGSTAWWTNPTAFADAAISGGVLTLSEATSVTLTLASGANITSINPAVCNEDHLYAIRCTNANPTFKFGSNIRLAGGVDFTPPSAGGTIVFKMRVNIAYEICRTVYG